MDGKRDFRKRKFHTSFKFKGKRKIRRRIIQKDDELTNRPNISFPDQDINAPSTSTDTGSSDLNYISASKRKIESWQKEECKSNDLRGEESCVIVQVCALSVLVSEALCKECKLPTLKIKENSNAQKGLAHILVLYCTNCETNLNSVYTSAKCQDTDITTNKCNDKQVWSGSSRLPFIINLKLVLAMRSIGVGHSQMERFLSIMGLPCLSLSSFQSLKKKLHQAAMLAMTNNLLEVKNKIITVYGNMRDRPRENTLDIGVMFDGTWQKRGHLSHNGIGVAIEIHTGFVIDFEVMANFCNGCAIGPNEAEDGYTDWLELHKSVCQKNTDCSSHAMEMEAALRIWQRSAQPGITGTKLHYTTFLSDGDSKAFIRVCDAKPYGPDISIIKEDCVNHVSKRFGTGIRKLNPDLPRGQKLNEEWIRKLSLYYQLAIINHPQDPQGMYNAILASLLHCSSSDDANNHRFCPDGVPWLCRYKDAANKGQPIPKHKKSLSEVQVNTLKPLYSRLSNIKLLERCAKGKTQNPAESLNNLIWMLCPKTRFASRQSVESAAAIAILWYNKGMKGITDVLLTLNIEPSHELVEHSMKADKKRIKSMQTKATAQAKHTRLKKKLSLAKQDEAKKKREGATYHPGGLDLGLFDTSDHLE